MNSSFLYSLLGHLVLVGIFFVTIPDFQRDSKLSETIPVFIDLKNVEFARQTNLPAKSKKEIASKPQIKKEPENAIREEKKRPQETTQEQQTSFQDSMPTPVIPLLLFLRRLRLTRAFARIFLSPSFASF